MVVRRKSGSSKSTSSQVPKDTTSRKKRGLPTGVLRAQVAPHSKTLSNGQPRPKKRG